MADRTSNRGIVGCRLFQNVRMLVIGFTMNRDQGEVTADIDVVLRDSFHDSRREGFQAQNWPAGEYEVLVRI